MASHYFERAAHEKGASPEIFVTLAELYERGSRARDRRLSRARIGASSGPPFVAAGASAVEVPCRGKRGSQEANARVAAKAVVRAVNPHSCLVRARRKPRSARTLR